MNKVPIVYIIYNRPEETKKSFSIIRDYKPEKLFIVADWAKSPTTENIEKCQKTREVTENIDWECEVVRDYSQVNLGCKNRIYSGISSAFENVEQAIILEDDCLPSKSFFQFCEEMLLKYKDEEKISHISGTNFLELDSKYPFSYTFSRHFHCWGWATWKSSWLQFDIEMKKWPKVKQNNNLGNILNSFLAKRYWTKVFDRVYSGEIDSWAYRWTLSCWLNGNNSIIPKNNLVTNIGFNSDSTNTTKEHEDRLSIQFKDLEFPLTHPKNVVANTNYDVKVEEQIFSGNYKSVIKNKLTSFLK